MPTGSWSSTRHRAPVRRDHIKQLIAIVHTPAVIDHHEPVATIDLAAERVHEHRWWTAEELAATEERIAPANLAELLVSVS